jgi:hypothetical protein
VKSKTLNLWPKTYRRLYWVYLCTVILGSYEYMVSLEEKLRMLWMPSLNTADNAPSEQCNACMGAFFDCVWSKMCVINPQIRQACSPPNPQTQNVILFGNRVFIEESKL